MFKWKIKISNLVRITQIPNQMCQRISNLFHHELINNSGNKERWVGCFHVGPSHGLSFKNTVRESVYIHKYRNHSFKTETHSSLRHHRFVRERFSISFPISEKTEQALLTFSIFQFSRWFYQPPTQSRAKRWIGATTQVSHQLPLLIVFSKFPSFLFFRSFRSFSNLHSFIIHLLIIWKSPIDFRIWILDLSL